MTNINFILTKVVYDNPGRNDVVAGDDAPRNPNNTPPNKDVIEIPNSNKGK